MSDLVERLRALHVWPQSTADTWPDVITPRHIQGLYEVGHVAHEAADRIEKLEAEVGRYREALEQIRDCTPMHGGAAIALKIIRQALQETADEA